MLGFGGVAAGVPGGNTLALGKEINAGWFVVSAADGWGTEDMVKAIGDGAVFVVST